MYIQRLIGRLIAGDTAVFHDAAGEVVPAERVRAEYAALRGSLLSRCAPGEIVAIHLPYDYRYLLSIYACMDAGLPYLPLRVSWPTPRIEQIRQMSGYAFAIDQGNIAALCTASAPESAAPAVPAPDQPLYVIYTSGSTGAPKGVVITRAAYEHFLRWINAEIACGPATRILFIADFTFDMSLLDIGLFLLKQCACYFSRFDGNLFRLAYEVETFGITSIATVPNNINMLLQDNIFERADFSSLDQLLLGGSRFAYGTYRLIGERLPGLRALYNLYGPTEATVYSHFQRLGQPASEEVVDANVSIGQPAPGLSCLLVDNHDQPIERCDTPGELLIGGIQVMREYLADPERTARSLVRIAGTNYYRTGDIGFRTASGNYYITGRKDDTLKRRGYRINLLDIDSYIQRIDAVQDCATVAIPDENTDNILVTFVIPRERLPEAVLRQKMAGTLVDYQVPDHIVYTDQFPTNNSGKVCKESLRRLFLTPAARAS